MPVLIPWGILAAISLWWGFHDGDWGTARWVWGLLALVLLAVIWQERKERRSGGRVRERAVTLRMAEELAVLRLVDEGALDNPPTWATALLESAAQSAKRKAMDVGFDGSDGSDVAWCRRLERDIRVGLVKERAEDAYPVGQDIRFL